MARSSHRARLASIVTFILLSVGIAAPAAEDEAPPGALRLHFFKVGPADATLLVTPEGRSVLFDAAVNWGPTPVPADGVRDCGDLLRNLKRILGVTHGGPFIDYYMVSHYHEDHIGCFAKTLPPPMRAVWDRGGWWPSDSFGTYASRFSGTRRTVTPGTSVVLDATARVPVRIFTVAVDAISALPDRGRYYRDAVVDGYLLRGLSNVSNFAIPWCRHSKCLPDPYGEPFKTYWLDENARSNVWVIEYGRFHAVIGGDLGGGVSGRPKSGPEPAPRVPSCSAGGKPRCYHDAEWLVKDRVGPVEVYKAHHHGPYTGHSNVEWLAATTPVVTIFTNAGFVNPAVLRRVEAVGSKWYQTHDANLRTLVTVENPCSAQGNRFAVNAGGTRTVLHPFSSLDRVNTFVSTHPDVRVRREYPNRNDGVGPLGESRNWATWYRLPAGTFDTGYSCAPGRQTFVSRAGAARWTVMGPLPPGVRFLGWGGACAPCGLSTTCEIRLGPDARCDVRVGP